MTFIGPASRRQQSFIIIPPLSATMEPGGYTQTEAALEQLRTPDRAYLTAMAEAVTQEHADYEPSTSAASSPSQKRKRGLPDPSTPESRRAKRTAPALSEQTAADNSAAYVESAVEAAQAAAAANVSAADFTALQQAAAGNHHDPEHHEHHEQHHEHHEHSEHHEHHELHESSDPANASSTAAAALGSLYPTMHVPPSTEETFAAQVPNDAGRYHHHEMPSVGPNDMLHGAEELHDPSNSGISQPPAPTIVRQTPPEDHVQPQMPKPAVGSEEWHKQRKDSHKEGKAKPPKTLVGLCILMLRSVERRRRETINEGINELAKIVPGCEKNKGSILQRTVSFIQELKNNESQHLERWTFEKLVTEQALRELSASNDELKRECERAYKELNTIRQIAEDAGVKLPPRKAQPSSTS